MKKPVYSKQTEFGVFYSDKPPKKEKEKNIQGVFVGFFSGILLIGLAIFFCSSSIYFENGELIFNKLEFLDALPAVALLFFLGLFIGVFLCTYGIRNVKKINKTYAQFLAEIEEKENYKKEHEDELFYQECAKKKVLTTGKADVARMKIIAKEMEIDCSEGELIKKFTRGKSIVEKADAITAKNEKEARIRKLREAEASEEKSLNRYISLSGSEKRVKMLQDLAASCRDTIKKYDNQSKETWSTTNNLYKLSAQKESDWAVQGGIASALAGGAAGVAVAADAQIRNAQVRASNAQLSDSLNQAAATIQFDIWRKQGDAKERLERYEAEIEAAKMKLVEYPSQKYLLELLSPSIKETKISETGAINFWVTFNNDISLKIYDTVDAVVDGSFKLAIIDGKKLAGEAYFTLGKDGSADYLSLRGICASLPEGHKDYKFIFKPHNLFAIEK